MEPNKRKAIGELEFAVAFLGCGNIEAQYEGLGAYQEACKALGDHDEAMAFDEAVDEFFRQLDQAHTKAIAKLRELDPTNKRLQTK